MALQQLKSSLILCPKNVGTHMQVICLILMPNTSVSHITKQIYLFLKLLKRQSGFKSPVLRLKTDLVAACTPTNNPQSHVVCVLHPN